jgi:hypothetical protein
MSEMSVSGGTVFGHMFNVLAWGVVVSLFAIILATLADGRGTHAVKILMGLKNRERGIDWYETLDRGEDDWRLLAKLAEVDMASNVDREVRDLHEGAVRHDSVVRKVRPIHTDGAIRVSASVGSR